MTDLSVLDRLRAYHAANPTDVAVVLETVRQNSEIDAVKASHRLFAGLRKRRSDAEREAMIAASQLARAWAKRASRAARLTLLETLGADAADVARMRRRDAAKREAARRAVDAAIVRELAREGWVRAEVVASWPPRRAPRTADHEPFPLINRWPLRSATPTRTHHPKG